MDVWSIDPPTQSIDVIISNSISASWLHKDDKCPYNLSGIGCHPAHLQLRWHEELSRASRMSCSTLLIDTGPPVGFYIFQVGVLRSPWPTLHIWTLVTEKVNYFQFLLLRIWPTCRHQWDLWVRFIGFRSGENQYFSSKAPGHTRWMVHDEKRRWHLRLTRDLRWQSSWRGKGQGAIGVSKRNTEFKPSGVHVGQRGSLHRLQYAVVADGCIRLGPVPGDSERHEVILLIWIVIDYVRRFSAADIECIRGRARFPRFYRPSIKIRTRAG